MNFLVPVYLAGLTALSLPLLFHLVRRTPRGRQEFSSLMFLAPSAPRLTRRSRLDHLVLLAMRLLALVLLALAFARPFLRETALLSLADLPTRQTALLIDVSASLRRGDLWPQALAAAEQELAGLNPQDDVALYVFDDRLRMVVPLESPRPEAPSDAAEPPAIAAGEGGAGRIAGKVQLIRSQLQSLRPTWGGTDLGTALTTVASELHNASPAGEEPREARIVLISDLQQGARLEGLSAGAWPPEVRLVVRQLRGAPATNARGQLLIDEEGEGPQEVRVRVINAADSTGEQFSLHWARGTATVDEGTPVYVPAGESRVVRFPRSAGARDADRIVLRGDDAEFDNIYYTVPPDQRPVRVAFAGREREDDPSGLLYYLKLALDSDPWRTVEFVPFDPDQLVTGEGAAQSRLAVLTQAISQESVPSLMRFVELGGVVLLVPSDREAADALSRILPDLSSGPPPEPQGGRYLLLGEIDFSHPLFAPFAVPPYGDFTKVRFWRHWPITLKTPAETVVVARFDNGDPALLERRQGRGRLLVLASGWQPAESQLALSTKFVPFVGGLLELAGGESGRAVTLAVNQPISLPARVSGETAAMQTPVGEEIAIAAEATRFVETDQPGIYHLHSGDSQTRFAVNLSLGESHTAPLAVEQLEQWGIRLGEETTRAERIARIRQQRDTELESRQKVWRWLLIGAVGLLVLETWWSGRAERQIGKETRHA
ncbi:MAG: BatA domain-containing protein [Planctomycetales bacterium]